MKIETLYENQWLKLNNLHGEDYIYTYVHESRCNGKIIGILPFRYGEPGLEYMLRDEFTPAWSTERNIISSITGGVEDDIIETTISEIKEEAGFDVQDTQLIPLGSIRTSKSSDTVYHLFSFNATNLPQSGQDGDGSELEKKAKSFWTSDISKSEDALVYTMYYRLHSLLNI